MHLLIKCCSLLSVIVLLGNIPDIFAAEKNITRVTQKRPRELPEESPPRGYFYETREEKAFDNPPSSFIAFSSPDTVYDPYALKKIIRNIKPFLEGDCILDDGIINWGIFLNFIRSCLHFEENFPPKWNIEQIGPHKNFDENCYKLIEQVKIAFFLFQKEDGEEKSTLDNKSLKLLAKKSYEKFSEQYNTIKKCIYNNGIRVLSCVPFLDNFMVSLLHSKIWLLKLEDLFRINSLYSLYEATNEFSNNRKKIFKEIKEKVFTHLKSLMEREDWATLHSEDFNVLQLYQYFFPSAKTSPPPADNIFINKIGKFFDTNPEKFSIEDMIAFYVWRFPCVEKIFEVVNKNLHIKPEEELYKTVWVLYSPNAWGSYAKSKKFIAEFRKFLENFPHFVQSVITKRFIDALKEGMSYETYKSLGKDKTLLKCLDLIEEIVRENNLSKKEKNIFKEMLFAGLKDTQKRRQFFNLIQLQGQQSITLETIKGIFNNKSTPAFTDKFIPAQIKYNKEPSILASKSQQSTRLLSTPLHKSFSPEVQQNTMGSSPQFYAVSSLEIAPHSTISTFTPSSIAFSDAPQQIMPLVSQSCAVFSTNNQQSRMPNEVQFSGEVQENTPQNLTQWCSDSSTEAQQNIILTTSVSSPPFSFDFHQTTLPTSPSFFLDFSSEYPQTPLPPLLQNSFSE